MTPAIRKPTVPVAFRVQKYLRALHYPAQKNRIVEHARQRGIEQEPALMEALLALPEGEYPSPVSLAREFTLELGRAALAARVRP